MGDTGSLQVMKHLSLVLVCDGLTGFQFDQKAVVDHNIGEVLANNSAIFILNSDGVLDAPASPWKKASISKRAPERGDSCTRQRCELAHAERIVSKP